MERKHEEITEQALEEELDALEQRLRTKVKAGNPTVIGCVWDISV